MIVPKYWAEARVQRARAAEQSQVTVRRFGWSDLSEADAQRMAHERAEAALRDILSGAKTPRREPKRAYNGAEGVPIREEILSRHGDVVITRNSYGARCLNTPNVLFADIDFDEPLRGRTWAGYAAALFAIALLVGIRLGSIPLAIGLCLAALIAAHAVATRVAKTRQHLRGGAEQAARHRVQTFLQRHPDWTVRTYRTPSGLRLLAVHELFEPGSPDVEGFFAAVGVDQRYAAMCRRQHCFRARLTAKPWRIGIADHLRPRPGVWPVNPEHLPRRQSWIERYEAACARFAACRYVETLGMGRLHPQAEAVRVLHDRLTQADSGREIA